MKNERNNEHLTGENVSYKGHHGKIVSHEEVEESLNGALDSEPWYVRLNDRVDKIGDKWGYKVNNVLWRIQDYFRGTFIR